MEGIGNLLAGQNGYAFGQKRIEAEAEIGGQYLIAVEVDDLPERVNSGVRPSCAYGGYGRVEFGGKRFFQALLYGNESALALKAVKIAAVVTDSKFVTHNYPIRLWKACTIYWSTPPHRYLSRNITVTNAANIRNAMRSRQAKLIFFILVRLGLAW